MSDPAHTYATMPEHLRSLPVARDPGGSGFHPLSEWVKRCGSGHQVTTVASARSLVEAGLLSAAKAKDISLSLGGLLPLSGRSGDMPMVPTNPHAWHPDHGQLTASVYWREKGSRACVLGTPVTMPTFAPEAARREAAAAAIAYAEQHAGTIKEPLRIAWMTGERKVRLVEYRTRDGQAITPTTRQDLEAAAMAVDRSPTYTREELWRASADVAVAELSDSMTKHRQAIVGMPSRTPATAPTVTSKPAAWPRAELTAKTSDIAFDSELDTETMVLPVQTTPAVAAPPASTDKTGTTGIRAIAPLRAQHTVVAPPATNGMPGNAGLSAHAVEVQVDSTRPITASTPHALVVAEPAACTAGRINLGLIVTANPMRHADRKGQLVDGSQLIFAKKLPAGGVQIIGHAPWTGTGVEGKAAFATFNPDTVTPVTDHLVIDLPAQGWAPAALRIAAVIAPDLRTSDAMDPAAAQALKSARKYTWETVHKVLGWPSQS